jgi:hypothetical protein
LQRLEVLRSRAKEEKCQDESNRLQKMLHRRKEVINGEDWLLANPHEEEVNKKMNTAESILWSPGFSLK